MKRNRRTAFILAAGLGTRLNELTSNKPKALVSINNKPLLKVVLEEIIKQDFNHIVINIHHFGEQIIRFIGDFFTRGESSRFARVSATLRSARNDGGGVVISSEVEKSHADVIIEISDERPLLMDTGGAILQALPYFADSEAVLVHNVDVLTNVDLKGFYDDFCRCDDAAWLLTQERNSKRKLVFDNQDNFLGRYNTETKEYDGKDIMPDNCKLLSFSGIHLFKPEYFKDFEAKPCYVFKLYQQIAENHRVTSKPIQPDYWFDLGTQEQLKNAELWLSSKR
ncbi:MAG: NTP transferase domain-containing protein [Bacteroidales bacterium]|nr:NTP transferase domain-containing protein [Bacteroidales bacterium]